jgi:hypothetical protein
MTTGGPDPLNGVPGLNGDAGRSEFQTAGADLDLEGGGVGAKEREQYRGTENKCEFGVGFHSLPYGEFSISYSTWEVNLAFSLDIKSIRRKNRPQ